MKNKNIGGAGQKTPRWARHDRVMAARRIEKDMGALYPLLGDEVEFGLQTLLRCSRECPQKESRIVGLLLYHHYLENQDAVDMLVRAGAFGAANGQARACMEAALQLIYMLEKDDECLAAAYMISNTRAYFRFMDILLAEEGETERNEVIRQHRKHHDAVLASSYAFRKAAKEMERLGHRARWFHAFGGPKTFRDLLRVLKMEPLYATMYEPMSLAVHAGNAISAMSGKGIVGDSANEEHWFRPLRSPEEGAWLNLVRSVHRLFFLSTMRVIIGHSPKYLPEMSDYFDQRVFPIMRGTPLEHLASEGFKLDQALRSRLDELKKSGK